MAAESADSATRTAFSALKPVCVEVMGLLKEGVPSEPGSRGLGALSTLADMIPALPPLGLPRCIDYVLIPLGMLSSACLGGRQRGPDAEVALERSLQCIAVLAAAAGPQNFLSEPGRASDVIHLAAATIAAAVSEQTSGTSVSEDALAQALRALSVVCEHVSGAHFIDGVYAGSGAGRGLAGVPSPLSSHLEAAHLIAALLRVATAGRSDDRALRQEGFDMPAGLNSRHKKGDFGRTTRAAAVHALATIMATLSLPAGTTLPPGSTAVKGRELSGGAVASSPGAVCLTPFLPGCATALAQLLLPELTGSAAAESALVRVALAALVLLVEQALDQQAPGDAACSGAPPLDAAWWQVSRARLSQLISRIFAVWTPVAFAMGPCVSAEAAQQQLSLRALVVRLARAVVAVPQLLPATDERSVSDSDTWAGAAVAAWDAVVILEGGIRASASLGIPVSLARARSVQLLLELPARLHPATEYVKLSPAIVSAAVREVAGEPSSDSNAPGAFFAAEASEVVSVLDASQILHLTSDYLRAYAAAVAAPSPVNMLRAVASYWAKRAGIRIPNGSNESLWWVAVLAHYFVAVAAYPASAGPADAAEAMTEVGAPWSPSTVPADVQASMTGLLRTVCAVIGGQRAARIPLELLRCAVGRGCHVPVDAPRPGGAGGPCTMDDALRSYCLPSTSAASAVSDAQLYAVALGLSEVQQASACDGSANNGDAADDIAGPFPALLRIPASSRVRDSHTGAAASEACAFIDAVAAAGPIVLAQVEAAARSLCAEMAPSATPRLEAPEAFVHAPAVAINACSAAALLLSNPEPCAPQALWLAAQAILVIGTQLRRHTIDDNASVASDTQVGAALASLVGSILPLLFDDQSACTQRAINLADSALLRVRRACRTIEPVNEVEHADDGNGCSPVLPELAAWSCVLLRAPALVALATAPAQVWADLDPDNEEISLVSVLRRAAAGLAASVALLQRQTLDRSPGDTSSVPAACAQHINSPSAAEILPALLRWRSRVVVQACGVVCALARSCGPALRSSIASHLPQLVALARRGPVASPDFHKQSSTGVSLKLTLSLQEATTEALNVVQVAASAALLAVARYVTSFQQEGVSGSSGSAQAGPWWRVIPLTRPLQMQQLAAPSSIISAADAVASAPTAAKTSDVLSVVLPALLYSEVGTMTDDAVARLSGASALAASLPARRIPDAADFVETLARSIESVATGRLERLRASRGTTTASEALALTQRLQYSAVVNPTVSAAATDLNLLHDLASSVSSALAATSASSTSFEGVVSNDATADVSWTGAASVALLSASAAITDAIVAAGQPADERWASLPVLRQPDPREVSTTPASWEPQPASAAAATDSSSRGPPESDQCSPQPQSPEVSAPSNIVPDLESAAMRRAAARCIDVALLQRHHAPSAPAGAAITSLLSFAPLPLAESSQKQLPLPPPASCRSDAIGIAISAALPILLPAARAQLVALVGSACRPYIGAASALMRSSDGWLWGAVPVGVGSTSMPTSAARVAKIAADQVAAQLRCTAASLHILSTAAVSLARHPADLLPMLHDLWPSLATLLPPPTLTVLDDGAAFGGIGGDASAVAAASESLRRALFPLDKVPGFKEKQRVFSNGLLYQQSSTTHVAAPAAEGAASPSFAWGSRSLPVSVVPAVVSPTHSPATATLRRAALLESTRQYMQERAHAMLQPSPPQPRRRPAKGSPVGSVPVIASSAWRLAMRNLVDSLSSATPRLPAQPSALLPPWPPASVAGGDGRHASNSTSLQLLTLDGSSSALAQQHSPSRSAQGQGSVLPTFVVALHSAALQLVAVLASHPIIDSTQTLMRQQRQGPSRESSGGGDTDTEQLPPPLPIVLHRGACAGEFLSARFDDNVWPGLRALLVSAVLAVAALSERQVARGGAYGPARRKATATVSLTPAQQLMATSLRVVALLARPTVTVEREPDADSDEALQAAKVAQQREAARDSVRHVSSPSEAQGVAASGALVAAPSADVLTAGGLPVPAAVPSFLPADARARSATAPPRFPTRYSVGRSVLHTHAWECACLLAAVVASGRSRPAMPPAAPLSPAAELVSLAAAALRALARFNDWHVVTHALRLYGVSVADVLGGAETGEAIEQQR